jgi:hypothetical protein
MFGQAPYGYGYEMSIWSRFDPDLIPIRFRSENDVTVKRAYLLEVDRAHRRSSTCSVSNLFLVDQYVKHIANKQLETLYTYIKVYLGSHSVNDAQTTSRRSCADAAAGQPSRPAHDLAYHPTSLAHRDFRTPCYLVAV